MTVFSRWVRWAALWVTLASTPAWAETWDETVAQARGQTVYFHAWGGDERTNAFIAWVGDVARQRHGITLRQVKLSDTADAVARVVAEKAAGKVSGGAVDLIWINGPNFLAMKEQGLLHGPFVARLPHARLVDLSPNAAASVDFTVPVEGYAAPWRKAQFVLTADTARVPRPPRSPAEILAFATAHPGRFTHPDAANFMGATFLKQVLIALTPDPAVLRQPATDENFATATAPLWSWYAALRPHLWRQGRTFPANQSVQDQLLADGEIDIAMSFDPASAAAAIEQGRFPASVRTVPFAGGSVGNISFVAIPFNANARAGAEVIADLLLEPASQARAQDIRVLGSFSVLDDARLNPTERALFEALPTHPALPDAEDLGPPLNEPHPSWMVRLAAEWTKRIAP